MDESASQPSVVSPDDHPQPVLLPQLEHV